jgi:hypothetical protein
MESSRPQRQVQFNGAGSIEFQWRNLYLHQFGRCSYPPEPPVSKLPLAVVRGLSAAGLQHPVRSFSPTGRGIAEARGFMAGEASLGSGQSSPRTPGAGGGKPPRHSTGHQPRLNPNAGLRKSVTLGTEVVETVESDSDHEGASGNAIAKVSSQASPVQVQVPRLRLSHSIGGEQHRFCRCSRHLLLHRQQGKWICTSTIILLMNSTRTPKLAPTTSSATPR